MAGLTRIVLGGYSFQASPRLQRDQRGTDEVSEPVAHVVGRGDDEAGLAFEKARGDASPAGLEVEAGRAQEDSVGAVEVESGGVFEVCSGVVEDGEVEIGAK